MNHDKPNIIYISADQWRGDCLGLYQNQHPVMTPHLNQLAAEGTLFTQAYADCPICMPQRVTMLTGKTGSQMRCLSNFNTERRPEFDFSKTLPARLQNEANYQTKAIGKMHFAPARSRYGFEHVALHPDDYLWWLEDHGYGGTFRGHGLGGNEVYPTVSLMPEPYYHTSWIVDQAVRFLDQRDPDVPFFLYMVFEAPHSPFDPPQPYDRMYDNFSIPHPCNAEWNNENAPLMFQSRRSSFKYPDLTSDAILETRRRYYGQISQIDYRLGLLLGALRSKGLDNNTAIVFTSDHGECLGDHGLFAKHCFLQSAARVPLIVRMPNGMPESAFSNCCSHNPVLTADICPTLLELAGLQPDCNDEGRSLQHAFDNAENSNDRVIFGETPQTACAINKNLKYIWYADDGYEQLFHLQDDPDDLHDLSDDSAWQKECEKLRGELTRYLQKNGSPMVQDGKLLAKNTELNHQKDRRRNPFACRGSMRGGNGY